MPTAAPILLNLETVVLADPVAFLDLEGSYASPVFVGEVDGVMLEGSPTAPALTGAP